jgi:GNAT superfamily N-acetyltransferase
MLSRSFAMIARWTTQRGPRMTPAPVEIRPLSPELLPDFLSFFDNEAFVDNPRWASCYCQFAYVDHGKVDWKTRTLQVNRAAACERIGADRMRGLLAYRDGKPVGWCNAAPRTMLDAYADEPDPDAARIGEITCFVVARAHRRSGVAASLLQAACARLKAEGLAIAEAIPRADASNDAQAHHGPLPMYLAAGFEIYRTLDDGRVVVRRGLL